jgi:ABC-type branched-subunit amino acid transport system substrate-binding protein
MLERRRIAWRRWLVAALLAMAGSLCAQGQELVLGHISSLSNPASADNAKNLSFGYRIYFDEVNAAGGVHGRRIRLVHKDDGLNAAKMVELTQELIADPSIIALVGFLNTAGLTEIATQDLLAKGGVAMISPLQGNRNIVGAENMFPFRSGYTDEMRALVAEAKNTQKQRLAIVYMNTAFGPPSAKFAGEAAKEIDIPVAVNIGYEVAPDKSEASMRATIDAVVKSDADAVLLLAAGRGAFDFVKGMRATSAGAVQIYGLSVLQPNDLVEFSGLAAARGVVLSQAVPYPYSGTLPLARDYLRLMKARAPADQAVNYQGFEGYIGARITVEALKRAGPNPTRKKVIDALKSMGELDIGGVSVYYTPKARLGWRGVDLTIIGATGRLHR